eukprot:TRINITY_DN93_c0_g1_i1.p1 TRINITY_DN93_c0_g1~~TRINITY_DN93_c0_g1_i1.p1  ORF type:complete len:319 (+),score=67.69 TRINITY_DN93_c0_g1_i1:202-1158(+)
MCIRDRWYQRRVHGKYYQINIKKKRYFIITNLFLFSFILMVDNSLPVEVLLVKVGSKISSPSYPVGSSIKLNAGSFENKLVWGRKPEEKKGGNQPAKGPDVVFQEKEVSRSQMIMYVESKQLLAQDTGSNIPIYFELEKGTKYLLTKNRQVIIEDGDHSFKFFVKDLKVPQKVMSTKNKKDLKFLEIIPEQTVKSNDVAANNTGIDITLAQVKGNLSQTLKLSDNVPDNIFKIGNGKDCKWVIQECKKEVIAEIGYLDEQGWYIQQPAQGGVSIKLPFKTQDQKTNKWPEKSAPWNLPPDSKIDINSYTFQIKYNLPK